MRDKLESSVARAPLSADLVEWLSKKRNRARKPTEKGEAEAGSLQDFYVWQHPSQTGWLSRDGFNEYAEYLPRRLGFLDDVFRRTEAGDLLVDVFMPEEQRQAFERDEPGSSILVLNTRERVLFLYQLLAADGDFLLPFVHTLAGRFGTAPFGYLDAGRILPEVCRDTARRFSSYGYTAQDREALRQLESTADKIEQQIVDSIETIGAGSRREQTSIPRLEWLIDLGLAERRPTDESTRVFALTEAGVQFAGQAYPLYEGYLSSLYADRALTSMLDRNFCDLVNQLYFGGMGTALVEGDLVEFVRRAYATLSKLRGYYLLRPLLLVSNLNALESDVSQFMEYAVAVDALERTYQAGPERLSYSIDRFATDYQVRLLD